MTNAPTTTVATQGVVPGSTFVGIPEPADYDFFRCQECRTLITRLQLDRCLITGDRYPCGHFGRISPSWPIFLEWMKWSVIRFAWLRLAGKAPR